MHALSRLLRRITGIFRRRRAEVDLGDELQFHLAMEASALERQGLSPSAARVEAHRRFGGVDRHAEACRDERGGRSLESIAQDIRYAVRSARHAPAFTAIVTLTLGLAIGANTAIFSVVDAVLLRPPTLPESDRLVLLYGMNPDRSQPRFSVSYADYLDWRRQTHSFTDMAAFTPTSASIDGDGEPERLAGLAVTPNFFGVLGVPAALGRTFGREDDDGAASESVILTDGFWRRRFAADVGIIGRRIQLNGRARAVIGVLPSDFDFGGLPVDAITVVNPASIPNVESHNQRTLSAIGRLKPGITLAEAQQDLAAVAARLADTYPDIKGWSANAFGFRAELTRQVRQPLLIVLAAAGLVLLIGCINVANLLVIRGASRGREVAMRQALGASRARLVSQFLIESAVLAVGGGLLGFAVAVGGTRMLLRLAPTGALPTPDQVGISGRVLAFGLGLSLLTAFLVGVWPALRSTTMALGRTLRDGGRTSAGFSAARVRRALVVTEVALALVLLTCAGLVLQSLWRMLRVNPGFSPEQVVAMQISLNRTRYPDSAQIAFYRELTTRLAARPGILAVSAANTPPISISGIVTPVRPKGGVPVPNDGLLTPMTPVTPGYFRTMKMPILSGRDVSWSDAAPTLLVSQSVARQFWPGSESAIGKRIAFGKRDTLGFEVVGVVPDVQTRGLASDPTPMIYMAYGGATRFASTMMLFVRSPAALTSVVPTVKATIRELDPTLPIFNVQTVEAILEQSVAQPRLNAALLATFATMALLLAGLGIYGVVSYSVAQRTQELGVRMALGAQGRDVFRLVLREGASLAAIGILIGLGGTHLATSAIQNWLFGVGRHDPVTLLGVATTLVAIAIAASFLPARRATRVDPVLAMRGE
jgi:predicted permease